MRAHQVKRESDRDLFGDDAVCLSPTRWAGGDVSER